MTNYSRFLVIIAAVFTISTASAVKNYTVTNNATLITGVDFYSFTDLLSSNLVAVGSTKALTTADASNYVNIRPYPSGAWSGPVIRVALEQIKDSKFTINSITPSPNKIKLDVQSGGTSIGSGTFINRNKGF